MKQLSLLIVMSLSLIGLSGTLRAQDPAAAAAIAERQDAEERYRQLNSAVKDLVDAQLAINKRLERLSDELQRLREEMSRAKNNTVSYASTEDLRKLADKVNELVKNREDDNKLILKELEKLAKAPPVIHDVPPTRTNPPAKDEPMFEYTIKSGDYLSTIVKDLNKQGFKLTVKQIVNANPGINPDNLTVGKKIKIPDIKRKE